MSRDGLSVTEKLLLAAVDLAPGEGEPFSAEDLVVSAWKRFPRAFGLRGHNSEDGLPLYPDSNRVYAELMGSKPIRKKGYLKKVGTKLYALTAAGMTVAEDLRGAESPRDTPSDANAGGKATLSRQIRNRLERLLRSRAVQRADGGELERVTFHDACVFWGITAHSRAIELQGAMAEVESAISAAEAAIETGASELRTGEGGLAATTTELLREVSDYLQERFESEITTIRKRT